MVRTIDAEDTCPSVKVRFGLGAIFLGAIVREISLIFEEEDLAKINNWAYQRKMSFNADPSKQVQEVIFS